MTKLESEKVSVNYTPQNVFDFLSNFNNFQKLMPEQVTNWTSTEEECSFTINGMATIGMKIVEKNSPSQIKIISNGKVPFNFTLDVLISEAPDNKCTGQLVFEADLNPMLKMMVEKPLGNFFNLLAKKLQDVKI